jgi:hypothetical protein
MGSHALGRGEGPSSSAASSARTGKSAVTASHENLLDRTVILPVDLRMLGRINAPLLLTELFLLREPPFVVLAVVVSPTSTEPAVGTPALLIIGFSTAMMIPKGR